MTLRPEDVICYKWLKRIRDDSGIDCLINIEANAELSLSTLLFSTKENAVEAITSEAWGYTPEDAEDFELVRVTKAVVDNPFNNKTPVTSNVLCDRTMKDWNMYSSDEWMAPVEMKQDHRLLIEQCENTGQVFFNLYLQALDGTSKELARKGLSGVIEVRNGWPAISIGMGDHDHCIHIEASSHNGLHVHAESANPGIKSEFYSYSHNMTFSSTFFEYEDSDWLMEARTDIANKHFEDFDFGEMLVVDDNGWEIADTHWTKTVFFEDPNGGDSIKGHYEMNFAENSVVVVDESGA